MLGKRAWRRWVIRLDAFAHRDVILRGFGSAPKDLSAVLVRASRVKQREILRSKTVDAQDDGTEIYSKVIEDWPRAIVFARRAPRWSEGKPNVQWMK
jgi:hypothetical protein